MAVRPPTVPPAPDWSTLIAAHGEPRLIDEYRALCGADEEAALDAYDTIVDCAIEDDVRGAHSVQSVPFLAAILRTPEAAAEYRAWLCLLLLKIGIGADRYRLLDGGLRERLHARGDAWAIAAYEAVRDAVPDLLPLLTDPEADPDPDVRGWTAFLLGWFPERADLILPALLAVRDRDPSAAVRAAATLAYTHCAAETPNARQLPLDADLDSPDPHIACAAAVSLVRRDRRAVPKAARDRIADRLQLAPDPSGVGVPAAIAVRALTATGPVEPQHIEACLTVLRRGHRDELDVLLEPLLDALFPVPAPPFAELTPAQRAFATIAAVGGAHAHDFDEALAAHGLPEDLGAYTGLGGSGRTGLHADGTPPGGEAAEIDIRECPETWIEDIDAHLWVVVDEVYDREHLDTYVDEPSYRAAAETWFAATEARLRQAYGPRDVAFDRDDPLRLVAWIHPYAGAEVVRTERPRTVDKGLNVDVHGGQLVSMFPPEPDWPALIAEHGEPALLDELRNLCDEDPEAAAEAFGAIADSTIHEDPYYENGPPAVPFLVAILRTPGAAESYRTALVQVLTIIAIGPAAQHFLHAGGLPALFRAAARKEPGEPAEAHYGNARHWGPDGYKAVQAAVPDLLPLLADPEDGVRAHVIALLGWFPERAERILPALTACAADPDTTPRARAAAAIAYAMCADTPASAPGWLHEDLNGDDPILSWGAAVALVRLHGTEAPAAAYERLTAFLTEPSPFDDGDPFPAPTNPPTITAQALLNAGTPTPEQIDAISAAFLGLDPADAYDMAIGLLFATFREPLPEPRPAFAELTPLQQRIVATFAAADDAWEAGVLSGELAGYGLPAERAELAAYLGDSA